MLIVLDKEAFGEVYLYLDHLSGEQIFVWHDFGLNTFHCFFASQVEDTKEQDYFTRQQAKTQGCSLLTSAVICTRGNVSGGLIIYFLLVQRTATDYSGL